MPKHLPTFKHLLHSSASTTSTQRTEKQKSVNDLINSSRNSRPSSLTSNRDIPPHLNGTGHTNITNGEERVWSPLPVASSNSSIGTLGGLVDIEFSGVHPAELLRRSNIAHRQASRSVAGPAPPPSWRPSISTSNNPSSSTFRTKSPQTAVVPVKPISKYQLASSSDLLSFGPSSKIEGDINRKTSLVEHCFQTVLRYLEDEEPFTYCNEIGIETRQDTLEVESYNLGGLLREQIPYLSTHLKSSLIQTASLLPSNHPHRLSDKSLLAILSDPPPYPAISYEDESFSLKNGDRQDSGCSDGNDNDWDDPAISEPIITYLPMTIHPSPHSILSQIPNLNSITSLNLAYSTLPYDLDKLVAVLPSSLRELSLVGVKFSEGKKARKGIIDNSDDDGLELGLKRGFSGLARKLIVLRVLDLSYPRFDLSLNILEGLLNPGNTRLPSLRVLGLRGYSRSKEEFGNGQDVISGLDGCQNETRDSEDHVKSLKKEVVDLLKGSGRSKYVDVVW